MYLEIQNSMYFYEHLKVMSAWVTLNVTAQL